MPNGDPLDGFFYPTLTLLIDSYRTYLCLGHILQSYHYGSFADTGKRQRTHRQHKLFCTYICLEHILESYHHGSFADTGKRQRTHRQHKLFCTYLCLGHILQSYHHGSFADTGKRQRTHRQHKLFLYIPMSWTHPPELSSW